jgi:uncharacterized protein (TIGR00297 family)
LIAWRERLLSTSGAVAASIIGSLAVASAWSWGGLLVFYFVVAAIVSRVGRQKKEARTRLVIAKSGPRDAAQVLANGGVFAVAALGNVLLPHPAWAVVAASSLAASEADTSATEIGTLFGGEPRSILDRTRVPAGTSGGVTAVGTVAALAGASVVALVARLLGVVDRPTTTWLILICGFAGAIVDSLLGATLQAKRWCDACNLATEHRVHRCGHRTRLVGGLSWLDNDAVNLVSAALAGLLAALLAR